MTTIVARCPYCRRGGVRAPERSIGSITKCSKCGSQFTIVPKEHSEDLRPASADAETDTKPVVEVAALTKSSPALPEHAETEPRAEREVAFTTSLIAGTLFGLAVVVAAFIPYGRFIGLGLCGLGLLLALVALLGEGLARKIGAAAAGLNLLAVLLLSLAPSWLGYDPSFDADQTALPKGPHSISLSSNDITSSDRTDASKAIHANGDVRVGVRVSVQPLELSGPKGETRRTRENVLTLHIGITNAGVERRIPFTAWALGNPDGVQFTDPSGKPLKVKSLDSGWKPAGFEKSEGVFPGKSADVILTYEPPASTKTQRVEYLDLELPGAGVGVVEPIRFRIPGPF